MSTAERLASCPFCGAGQTTIEPNGRVWGGMGWSDPVSVSVRHWCTEMAGQPSRMIERVGRDEASAIAAWNRRTPADGGGQGVTPLSDDDALALARKHLEKGLSWEPRITRCTNREIKALIRAVERHHRIGTPASTGGEDHA